MRNFVKSFHLDSVFVQLLLLLLLAETGVEYGLPCLLPRVQPDLINPREMIRKVPEFLSGPANPNVVIMGSSLVLAPAIHCDAAMLPADDPNKKVIRTQPAAMYDKAVFLEGELSRAFGRPVTVRNLGVSGSPASDCLPLFQSMVSQKKKPDFVIVGMAPRDVINNTFPDPEKAPISKAVKKFQKERETSFWSSLGSFRLKDGADLLRRHYDDAQLQLGLVKYVTYGRTNTFRACGSFTAEPPIQDVQLPTEAEVKRCSEVCSKLFNPITDAQIQAQWARVEKMIVLAKQEGIPVVIVNQPIAQLNKTLLPADVLNKYYAGLKDLVARTGTILIDEDIPGTYVDSDFRDTIHLNAKGGRKFYHRLVTKLERAPGLVQRVAHRS